MNTEEKKWLPQSDLDWKEGDPVRVGLGVTLGGYGMDRHPATVVKVSNDLKKVWIRADGWERTDNNGMSETQSYRYYAIEASSDDEQAHALYTLRKNGRYVRDGEDLRKGSRLHLGFRNRWNNYSF